MSGVDGLGPHSNTNKNQPAEGTTQQPLEAGLTKEPTSIRPEDSSTGIVSPGQVQAADQVQTPDSEKTRLFFEAVDNSNLGLVSKMIFEGMDPNVKDRSGRNALHRAAALADALMIEGLMDLGLDIDALDNDGKLAIHIAAEHGNAPAVKELSAYGSRIDVLDNKDHTPLFYAVDGDHGAAFEALWDINACFKQDDSQQSNLIDYAFEHACSNILLKLIGKMDHATLALKAVQHNEVSMLKKLIELGLNIDKYNSRAAFLVLNHIVATPSSANLGELLLLSSIKQGSEDVFDLLLDLGVKTDRIYYPDQNLIYHAVNSNQMSMLRKLVSLTKDFNRQYKLHYQLLSLAITKKDQEAFEALVDLGANIHAQDRHGWNLVLEAITYNSHKILKRLLDLGVNSRLPDSYALGYIIYRGTMLHRAALEGAYEAAKVLIEAGAEIDAKSELGYTPLHAAAARGKVNLIRLFLEHGADIEARTNDMQTPLQVAVAGDHSGAAELLLSSGAVAES